MSVLPRRTPAAPRSTATARQAGPVATRGRRALTAAALTGAMCTATAFLGLAPAHADPTVDQAVVLAKAAAAIVQNPIGVTIGPTGTQALVTNDPAASVFTLTTGPVSATLVVGSISFGEAVGPLELASSQAYATDLAGSAVSVVRLPVLPTTGGPQGCPTPVYTDGFSHDAGVCAGGANVQLGEVGTLSHGSLPVQVTSGQAALDQLLAAPMPQVARGCSGTGVSTDGGQHYVDVCAGGVPVHLAELSQTTHSPLPPVVFLQLPTAEIQLPCACFTPGMFLGVPSLLVGVLADLAP